MEVASAPQIRFGGAGDDRACIAHLRSEPASGATNGGGGVAASSDSIFVEYCIRFQVVMASNDLPDVIHIVGNVGPASC